MAIFSADVPRPVSGGRYNFDAIMSSGGVAMQYSPTQDSGQTVPFGDVEDGTFTATKKGTIDLPECLLKAGITGDATFTLNKVPDK